MSRMRTEYIEKIYAGWLAKIIGIRLGAPVEGWSSKKIRDVYGRLSGYAVKYNRFAADDDSNGPLFFIRTSSRLPAPRFGHISGTFQSEAGSPPIHGHPRHAVVYPAAWAASRIVGTAI